MSYRPGKNFRVGAMRHRITIESASTSPDDAGQPIRTWSTLRNSVPAQFHQTGGGQTYRGQQLQETIDAVFVTRYRTGYDTTQRIVHDGTTYGIMRISPVDGVNRYLEIFCKAIAN